MGSFGKKDFILKSALLSDIILMSFYTKYALTLSLAEPSIPYAAHLGGGGGGEGKGLKSEPLVLRKQS